MATEKRLIDAIADCKVLREEMDYLLELTKTKGFNTLKERMGLEVAIADLGDMPTVDAVEVADMKEFAEDVVRQFGCYCHKGGRLHITHGGLSTLEQAFDILGWENPHPVPECECEIEGCHEHATCGVPTADGYKRVCGKHMAKMDGDGNVDV